MVSSRSIAAVKKRLQILFIVCLLIGIGLRCTNAAHKVYWHDEVYTTIRVLGHSSKAIEEQVLQGATVSAADLQAFQKFPEPRRWSDTWSALASHPEHPPLFYFLERFWVGVFAPSITSFRALAVVFGLLLLPLTYWMGRQLWQDHWAAVIATCLMAVSPIQLLYAQEAREYSLWACLILLANGCLLQAMRAAGRYSSEAVVVRSLKATILRKWGLYSVSMALMLYTTLLSVLVIVAHGLYVLISGSRQHWQRWAMALGGALFLFVPWGGVILSNRAKLDSVTDWTSFRQPLGQLVKFWGLHLSSTVIDLGLPVDNLYTYVVPFVLLILLLVALWQLLMVTSPSTMAFCIMVLMVPALGLILPDMIDGGQLSVSTRYFMPSLLMVTLVLAGWLRQLILSDRGTYRLCGQSILVLLLVVGFVSGSLSAVSFTWWNKNINYHINTMGEVIRQTSAPLVMVEIGETGLGSSISLSYAVAPETAFLLFKPGKMPEIPTGYSDYFVSYANGELLDAIASKTGRSVVLAGGDYPLWRLE
ncbi:glycosyltransferase family 39 protein [Leptothoe spongobia]|uniref:Glycosyltransferase family 39 protein n=1 Tax=Leptothoe spongobia TAU-MAC 1115 TaxID=1967444 RepID=A0A947DEL8_9CYAN|nr:glycosyltransferase family 39 protein [Leptothoe spongobia]MBT9315602.1 glycosyltransferase family 39 protein [Leptothoe spongobia TAU-MAC 1115]